MSVGKVCDTVLVSVAMARNLCFSTAPLVGGFTPLVGFGLVGASRSTESMGRVTGRIRMQRLSRQRGISLIEVLMAVLIFSIGLIGLAGLMVMATRSNHAAYQRTQVTFLASTMADRMGANPVGVWNGNYDSSSYPVSASTATNNDCSAGCAPDALAASDQRAWSRQLTTFLPNVKAKINCDNSTAGFTPSGWTLGTPASGATVAVPADPGQVGMRPPYGGKCTMSIQWDEQQAGSRTNPDGTPRSDIEQQKFDWTFQP